jgi:7,8-dihydropterin-6-yl-methyl-4-(beta-D-ribofuranosyl)aminobenzene 5'-phosphate synthase
MNITVLIDNLATGFLHGENGLSMLIETQEGLVLWDTGQSNLAVSNADKLGISLDSVHSIALSHGHYDHTTGLKEILGIVPDASVFAHPNICLRRYTPSSTHQKARSIGCPFDMNELSALSGNLILDSGKRQILPGVCLTGEIPRIYQWEDPGGAFFLDEKLTVADIIPDDCSLVVETKKGIAVLLGCCHSGIANTLAFVSEQWNTKEFALIAGGMHLLNASKERISKTIENLGMYRIHAIAPGHCTGWKALCALSDAFHDAVCPLHCGWTWNDD